MNSVNMEKQQTARNKFVEQVEVGLNIAASVCCFGGVACIEAVRRSHLDGGKQCVFAGIDLHKEPFVDITACLKAKSLSWLGKKSSVDPHLYAFTVDSVVNLTAIISAIPLACAGAKALYRAYHPIFTRKE